MEEELTCREIWIDAPRWARPFENTARLLHHRPRRLVLECVMSLAEVRKIAVGRLPAECEVGGVVDIASPHRDSAARESAVLIAYL